MLASFSIVRGIRQPQTRRHASPCFGEDDGVGPGWIGILHVGFMRRKETQDLLLARTYAMRRCKSRDHLTDTEFPIDERAVAVETQEPSVGQRHTVRSIGERSLALDAQSDGVQSMAGEAESGRLRRTTQCDFDRTFGCGCYLEVGDRSASFTNEVMVVPDECLVELVPCVVIAARNLVDDAHSLEIDQIPVHGTLGEARPFLQQISNTRGSTVL